MSKHLSFLFVLLFLATEGFSQNYLVIEKGPVFNGKGVQGKIEAVEIEITPSGNYANVELTFNVGVMPTLPNEPSPYSIFDTLLEAELNFRMPPGTYVYGAEVWIDTLNTIQAIMVERDKTLKLGHGAGTTLRKRDPLLLLKFLGDYYKLRVYPTGFNRPRKVRIFYSVPFNRVGGIASMPLPVDIITTSRIYPDIEVRVNYSQDYVNPYILQRDYAKYKTMSGSGYDMLHVPASDYTRDEIIEIAYENDISKPVVYESSSAAGKYYQLGFSTEVLGVKKQKNTVFILYDEQYRSGVHTDLYSTPEVKNAVKAIIKGNYLPTDSVNVFYAHNKSIVQASAGWVSCDSASVNALFSQIPDSFDSYSSSMSDLLKQGLLFCATKPGEADAVLINDDVSYNSSSPATLALIDDVRTYLGGFKNKIYAISSAAYGLGQGAGDLALHDSLATITGGRSYTYTSQNFGNNYGNWADTKFTDFSFYRIALDIFRHRGDTISLFDIVSLSGQSALLDAYDVYYQDEKYLGDYHIETGKYFGNIGQGDSVEVQMLTAGGPVVKRLAIDKVIPGDSLVVKSWISNFIARKETVARPLKSEIIDTSIAYRILSRYTALVCLEAGDTVLTNVDDNPFLAIHDVALSLNNDLLNVYPNPFNNRAVISFPEEVKELGVYDITGRKVFGHTVAKGEHSFEWNGKSANGNELAAGLYLVVASAGSEELMAKVLKQ